MALLKVVRDIHISISSILDTRIIRILSRKTISKKFYQSGTSIGKFSDSSSRNRLLLSTVWTMEGNG